MIFEDDKDKDKFLRTIQECKSKSGFKSYGYCIENLTARTVPAVHNRKNRPCGTQPQEPSLRYTTARTVPAVQKSGNLFRA